MHIVVLYPVTFPTISGHKNHQTFSQKLTDSHVAVYPIPIAPYADSVVSGAARSAQSPRLISRKFHSMGTTNISSVVTSLHHRSGEELRINASSRLLTATYLSIVEWICSERMILLPPEGSDYDKVLTWAQLFVNRLHSFDVEIEKIAGDSYLAAQLSYGYCTVLLELGKENVGALMVSLGFFYSISMFLDNLIERTGLFTVTAEIQEQLILALSDLVTLVANVAWLAPEYPVISGIADNSSHLAHDREELTCLWLTPYLTRFLKTQQKHLSITGPPGSGKTVLASIIIDHLRRPHGGVSYQTLLVPINGIIAVQTNSYAIARTILSQLLDRRIGNAQLFRILIDALHRTKTTAGYETYETIMWNAVDQARGSSLSGANKLILVVDGLDEAACGEDKLLQRLTQATIKASNTKLITLGSRTPTDIAGQSHVQIVDDMIFDDIAAVVRACFGSSQVFSNLSTIEKENVVDRIAHESKSSFLFARLITKRVRHEPSAESLRKAVESLLTTKPSLNEFVLHALQQREELSALASIQVDKQTISDTRVDPLHALKPLNSLVFLKDDYFSPQHGLIRYAVVHSFSQGQLIASVKDRHTDLVTRLLVYIKTNVTEQHEPSSLTSLDDHDAAALLDKHPLLEFALRYWVSIFRQSTVFTKYGETTASKEIAKVLPTSITAVRLLRYVLDNVSTPDLVTLRTSLTNICRTVLTTENVTTLQAIITLATLLRNVTGTVSSTLFYNAAMLSQKLLTIRHIVAIQMVTIFLELTTESITESKTDIMVKREKMLLVLVECYKIHHGKTSERVISILQQLVDHYRTVKETQNAEDMTAHIQSITSIGHGSTTNGTSGNLDVRIVDRGDRLSSNAGYIFRLNLEEEDELLETTENYEVEALVNLANRYLQNRRLDLAQHIYVEFWQRVTRESRVHRSAEWEEKKMKVILAYANLLRDQKREYEACSVLTTFWQDYQQTNVTLSESTVIHLEEIAKTMKSVNLSTTALSVLKNVSEYYHSMRRTDTSSYKEVQQLLQTTSEEVMQSASSASVISEAILENSTASNSIDQSFCSSTDKLIGLYISQRRWQQATRTMKRILHNTWSALSATTLQDVTLPHKHCYHFRHRLAKEQDTRLRIYYYAVFSGLGVEDKLRQQHVSELHLLERTSQTDLIISVYQELLNDYTKHYDPDHITVIQTLRKLAELTRPRPIFLNYYQQIIQTLNKDGKYHPDSLGPLNIAATKLWKQGRYSDALHCSAIIFMAWVNQPTLSPKFQDEKFVQGIFTLYTQCLRAVHTEFSTLHKVNLDYQAKCKGLFGASASITVQATLALAQLCQVSKHYETEAIRLYEDLLKINSNEVNSEEIRATLDALYEEQSALISNSRLAESASPTQVEQAVKGKTDLVVQELQEATVQILSEKSTTRLSEAAWAIAVDLSDEIYRQVIRKDSTNVKSTKSDLTSKSRESLIFLAQLEHHLHRQSSTVTEILTSLSTQLVDFEDFQQHIRSNSDFLSASTSAARLYYFLTTNNRQHVAGKRIGFKSSSEFSTRQSQDAVRSIGIASNRHVSELIKLESYDEACDLALASFSMNICDRSLRANQVTRKKMLDVSATIIQDVLEVLRALKINQGDYPTLAVVLTTVWSSREAQRDWDSSVTLSLGRLYIMARYLIGETTSAARLAEDIVYNCRRIHGARHSSTLQMSVLLSQLYTSIANRYYKRSAALHERILRALSDPTFADLDGSLDGDMSTGGSALDGDFANDSFFANGVAIDDEVRHHFKLLLAVQRLGGWPKEYNEYKRLNANLCREYTSALEAESNEDQVDADFKDWQIFSESRRVDGVDEEELSPCSVPRCQASPSKQSNMTTNPGDLQLLIDELRANLKCEILTPDSEGYAESVLRWSDAVPNAAAIIVYTVSAQDVSVTVQTCTKYKVPFAVAGGKHTTSTGSSCYGGLVIDLGRMRQVTMEPDSKRVHVGGGCRWKDVDDVLVGRGLALVEGIVNDTGVGGITLGGGYGWLAPRYGLVLDSLVAATIVLGNGSITVASGDENPDLFWAIRGAGQCFGVVVEFVFEAHDHQDPVWAGMLGFPLPQLEGVFDFANALVETTNGDSAMVVQLSRYPFANSGRDLGIMAIVFHYGDAESAKAVFRPLLDLNPLVNTTMAQSYASVNNMLTEGAKRGGRNVSKGAAYTTPLRPAFVKEVIVPELDRLHLEVPGSDRSMVEFEFYKPDKWCEIPVTATAHGHRGRVQNVMIGLYWQDAQDDVRVEESSRFIAKLVTSERLEYGSPAVGPVTEYGNYDHLSANPRDVYGVNYERLVELKKRYDPNNVFNKWYSLVE
ncbi:hypothetical protein BDW62DRAFT_211211 [Aspergillus aurantiobrunneus]